MPKPFRTTGSLALALTLLAACQDSLTDPQAVSGPINVSVQAATGSFVYCGEEIPIIATVTWDRKRTPLPNFHVNFNVLAGGGSMFAGAGLTNLRGQARDYWTIGSTANVVNTLAVRAVDPTTGAKHTYFTQSVTTLSQIAFSSYARSRSTTYSIWVMNADGSGLRQLTDDAADDRTPAWSPDGRQIAFASSRRAGSSSSIWVINTDGTGLQRLTDDEGNDHSPSWSPDGRQVAFVRAELIPRGLRSVWVINADGSGLQQLTEWSEYDNAPAWSPGGRQIAFARESRLTTASVWVMNVDGTGQRQLTDQEADDGSPVWSPHGRKLAFRSDERGSSTSTAIWVMNPDGTGVLQLSDDAADDEDPAWSPDGGQIAFGSTRAGSTSSIWVMNVDGSGLQRLTDDAADDHAPAWSGCIPRPSLQSP